MKKFMKNCAIIALILVAVGFALATVAGTIRGRTTIADVVEAATGGRVKLNWESWNIFFEKIGDDLGDINYDINESMDFDRHYEVLKGDVDKYCVGSDIQKLEIEVGGCLMTTKPSGDDSFYLEAQNIGKIQCYVEGNTLYVKSITSVRKWNQMKNSKITLYIPDACSFEKADIELGAGSLEFGELNAQKASLEVGAGQIEISCVKVQDLEVNVGMGRIELYDMDVEKLQAEIGMGELQAQGALHKKADVSCSMGNVEMTIDGREEDFDYSLEGGMGNMSIGGMNHSGLGFEKTVRNGAAKEMKLECAMGNVSVRFTEN